jgi:hypothetical protein
MVMEDHQMIIDGVGWEKNANSGILFVWENDALGDGFDTDFACDVVVLGCFDEARG